MPQSGSQLETVSMRAVLLRKVLKDPGIKLQQCSHNTACDRDAKVDVVETTAL
jgi:hypothetical protein